MRMSSVDFTTYPFSRIIEHSVVTPLIRRVLWTAAIVAVLGTAAVVLSRVLQHKTIAFSQKCGGGNCWGYRLEQYAFSKQTVLTISATWGLQLEYDLPKMSVEKASEERWLADDRALYLNLRLKPLEDPQAPPSPLQLLYDFQRGQLYMTSPLQLWRSPDYQSGNPGRNWMSEAEFQSVLTRIEP